MKFLLSLALLVPLIAAAQEIDDSGTLLLLDGGLIDGAMVLSGQRPAHDGNGMTQHRISWTVLFDGLYIKAPASP